MADRTGYNPTLSDLRSMRMKAFNVKARKNNNIVPLFPGYACGPLIERQQSGEGYFIPKTEKELIAKCRDYIKMDNFKTIPNISFDDLLESLKHEKSNHGIPMHLLHIHPFSFIGEVTCDSTKHRPFHSETEMVQNLLVELSKDTVFVGVPTLPMYADILSDMKQRNMPLACPIEDKESNWGKSLHIRELDIPFQRNRHIGMYMTARNTYIMKIQCMMKRFEKFEPYTLLNPSPLETNAILRWKKAAEIFNFNYRIEQISTNTFARIPNDLNKVIYNEIKSRNGKCSVSVLLERLNKSFRSTSLKNIVELLRHTSRKKESRIIFYCDKIDDGSELCAIHERCIDADIEGHKGKLFWQSLSEFEQAKRINMNYIEDDEKIERYAKKCLVGFPYECGLRKKDDVNTQCEHRFENRDVRVKHMKNEHAMDNTQLRQVKDTFDKFLPFKEIESDHEFLQRHNILEEFDIEKLMKISDLGVIVDSFIKLRCKNKEIVSEMKLLLHEYSSSQAALQKELENVIEDPSESFAKKLALKEYIKKESNKLKFCNNVSRMYESILLPDDLLKEHLNALCYAMDKQSNALSKFNKMKENINQSMATACNISKALTGRWHKELQTAGMNIASVNSDAYLQQAGGEMGPETFTSTAVGVINALEEHRVMSEKHTSNIYETYFKENPEAGDKIFQKRKRDDDDENGEGHPHKAFKQCVKDNKGKIPTGIMVSKKLSLMKNTKEIQQDQINFMKNQTLDVVLPLDITIDLRDHKHVLLYILCKLNNCRNNTDYIVKLSTIFVNIITNMFGLTEEGTEILSNAFQKLIMQLLKATTVEEHRKRLLWHLFLSAIDFINCNQNGIMNKYFRVRLSFPNGRQKMLPLQFRDLMYACSNELSSKEMIDQFINGTHTFFKWSTNASCIIPSSKHQSSSIYKREMNQQKALLQQLSKLYMNEVKDMRHGRLPVEKTYLTTPSKVVKNGKRSQNMDSLLVNNKPNYRMSDKADIENHTQKVYDFRHQICVICREPFVNRPLEGFNCIYRSAERQFRKEHKLTDSVNIEMNEGLNKAFMAYVSKKIKEKHSNGEQHSTGIHLFHMSCIRRAIQFAALDQSKSTIDCPICKTEMYNEYEKLIILQNIVDIACDLMLAVDKEEIIQQTFDQMIDLKGPAREMIQSVYPMYKIPDSSDQGDKDVFKCESDRVFLSTSKGKSKSFNEVMSQRGREGCLLSICNYVDVVVNENSSIRTLYDTSEKGVQQEIKETAEYALDTYIIS